MTISRVHKALLVTTLSILSVVSLANSPAEPWEYVQVDNSKKMWGNWDEPEWLRYFGLDAGDLNRDGLQDIVSGKYIYLQPPLNTDKKWQRIELQDNVDAILTMDIDGDEYADVIAQALPNVYWYEATDKTATSYTRKLIGTVPATSHVNSQGFEKAQILNKQSNEFVIAGNGNIYLFSPTPSSQQDLDWTIKLIAANTSDEGIGVGDIDQDGDMDIAAGRRPEGEGEPTIIVWFENPGNIDKPWQDAIVGRSAHPIDRVEIADLNNDGKSDIIITEERYPGLEPDAHFFWFEQQANNSWKQHTIVKQYSINNLDIADFDLDGDLDILTAEHKGPKLELQIWSNNGQGTFEKSVIDTGKENHLGTQWVDMDNDGDLDIIGTGWDQHQFIHFWRNNSKKKVHNSVKITHTTYLGRAHFLVKTQQAEYYFDVAGGGFSRLIDNDGKDWIDFKMDPWGQYPASAASAFRGLPNLVHGHPTDSGAGHPGFNKCVSMVINGSSIKSQSKSGLWEWQWTFYDDHAVFEMLKLDPDAPYWFLYEGPPGGDYDINALYHGTNKAGPLNSKPDFYKNKSILEPIQWLYVGNQNSNKTLYFAHQQQDKIQDLFGYLGNTTKGAQSDNGMVVFGLGRGLNAQPLLKQPIQVVIGLYPFKINNQEQHQTIAQYIEQQLKRHQKI